MKKIVNSTLILIYLVSIVNIYNPILRFENRKLNLIYTAVIMLIPIYLATQPFRIKNRLIKALSILSTWIISFFSILALVIIALTIGGMDDMGYDPSFELWQEMVVDGYTIDTYRINGGAMTSYGILVRQEKSIAFGLKVVKNIYSKSRSGEANIDWNDHVLLIGNEEFELKEGVY